MPITQINIFTCEVCEKTEIETNFNETFFNDPVIGCPKGWDFLQDENTMACEKCIKKEQKKEEVNNEI